MAHCEFTLKLNWLITCEKLEKMLIFADDIYKCGLLFYFVL